MSFPADPISNIEWRDASTLHSNDWNPNVVFTPELKLLERSILSQGWIQPILINRNGMVIDGFHRWMLSKDSKLLKEKYAGSVPCAVLNVDDAQARILTVRMNRAKGSHVALRMADLVKSLVDDAGMSIADVAKEIGGTKQEVELLYQNDIFKARNLKDYKYSQAWVPGEDRFETNPEKVEA